MPLTAYITGVANRNYFGGTRYNKNAFDGDTIGAIEYSLQMMRVMKGDLGKSHIEVVVVYYTSDPYIPGWRTWRRTTVLLDPNNRRSAREQVEASFKNPVWRLEEDGG